MKTGVEAEKEAVVAASVGLNDGLANADGEAVLAGCHEECTGFTSFPDIRTLWAYQDFDADSFAEPDIISWDDYEVLVSSDLAVIKGNMTREHPQYGSVNVFQTSVFKKEDSQWKLIHNHQSYGGP